MGKNIQTYLQKNNRLGIKTGICTKSGEAKAGVFYADWQLSTSFRQFNGKALNFCCRRCLQVYEMPYEENLLQQPEVEKPAGNNK
jgi:hypothetical protein